MGKVRHLIELASTKKPFAVQVPFSLPTIGVGTVNNDARNDGAVSLQLGKPGLTVEDFARGKRPIVGKCILQLRNHRTFDAKVQILNRAWRMRGQNVAVPDVHPAGKRRMAVHHQDLAVIAQIDRCHAPRCQERRRQKLCTSDTRSVQSIGNGGP
jgi:hypothetical protein